MSASRDGFALILADSVAAGDAGLALGALLSEAERILPAKIKQRIAQTILVELDGSKANESISIPVCDLPFDAKIPPAAAPPIQTLGVSQLAERTDLPHRIVLHPGVQHIARKGREQSVHFACGHQSLYQLVLATLLHEVLHLYDQISGVSKNPAYQHLLQFSRQGIRRKLQAHNQLRLRSPDIYEFQNIEESLAVNFEYFILDPEFQCRRPAVYQFLKTELAHQPFVSNHCVVNTLVYAGNQPVYIDPDRVYQIHYLFAARGKGIASRFGHSMFRIVSCSPLRTRVDESCLEDLHDQVVLSFIANLREDLTINSWKGLTGKYMSQLLIKPLTEILNDYTEQDYRDLQSFPLQMNREEIRQFINHSLELYWGYSGKYYFLTNNCADESLRLIQSVRMDRQIQALETLTPRGLRDDLIKNHIADDSVLADREIALKRGYLFQSALERYEKLYLTFRDTLPAAAPRKLNRYLKSTQAAERRTWATLLRAQPAVLSGLFTIEGLILQRLMKDIERLVLARVLFKRDPRYVELGQRLKDHLSSLRLPWELVKQGYGVPLLREFGLAPRQVHPAFPDEILTNAMTLIKIDDAKLYDEYVQTEQNRKFMLAEILKSSMAFRNRLSLSSKSHTNLAGEKP